MQHEVSLFGNVSPTSFKGNYTVDAVLKTIRSEKFKNPTDHLRTLTDAEAARVYKAGRQDEKGRLVEPGHFYGVTWSGTFGTGKKAEHLQDHSGLLCMDVDGLTGQQVTALYDQLRTDEYTHILFISPSGSGLKWVARIDLQHREEHKAFFRQLTDYLHDSYGLSRKEDILKGGKPQIDPSGSDVSRLCFLPHAPDVYHNPDSEVMPLLPEYQPVTEAPKPTEPPTRQASVATEQDPTDDPTHQRLKACIAELQGSGIDLTATYEDWVKIGLSFASMGEDGRKYYHEVSRIYPKYDYAETDAKFSELLRNSKNLVEIGTFFHICREAIGSAPKENYNHRRDRHTNFNSKPAEKNQRQPVGPFPVDVFPASLRRVIEQTGCHSLYKPDWIGAAILYATSVAVGNCLGTRYNTYEQKATIYLAIVGMPGTNKSGPLEYAVRPLRQVDKAAYFLYRQQTEEYDHWQGLTPKQRKDEGLSEGMNPPVYRTTLVSDVTQEFLVKTHQQNPLGLGLFMDELAGWFKNFTRYTKGSEEQFWLSVWSFAPVKSGRKTAGIFHVDSPYLPVAGTIQPGVLGELAKDGRNQNGFTDRILFAYPDDQQKQKDSDSELDPDITAGYKQYMDNLLTLRDAIEVDEHGEIQTKWLPFAPDAFAAMRTWRDGNTDRANQTDNPAYKGIYAKFDAYCIRFALLIELMDWGCNQSDLSRIRLTSVERAINLTDYFRQNAEKVHHVLNDQSAADRLPAEQQRLFNGLPDEINTANAVTMGAQMMPKISESSVKRLLRNSSVFRRIGRGEYEKLC